MNTDAHRAHRHSEQTMKINIRNWIRVINEWIQYQVKNIFLFILFIGG